jgi:hypothetical protein
VRLGCTTGNWSPVPVGRQFPLAMKPKDASASKPMWRKRGVKGWEGALRHQRRCRFLLTTTVRRFETSACPSCSIDHIAEARCRLPAFPVTRGLSPASQRARMYWKTGGRRGGRGARERDRPVTRFVVLEYIPRALESRPRRWWLLTSEQGGKCNVYQNRSHMSRHGPTRRRRTGTPSRPARNTSQPVLIARPGGAQVPERGDPRGQPRVDEGKGPAAGGRRVGCGTA